MRKLIMLLVISAVPFFSFAQEAPLAPAEPAQPLTLTIKADKEVYEAGEEVKLLLRFQNNSDENISVCLFDIEHRLREGLKLVKESADPPKDTGLVITVVPLATYKLKDWTMRKLSLITKEDFIPLKSQEEYSIELMIETVISLDSSWKYIIEEEAKVSWGEGIEKLPIGIYHITSDCNIDYFQETIFEEDLGLLNTSDAWTGTLTSNTISIEVREKK